MPISSRMLSAMASCRPEPTKIPHLRYGGACTRQQPFGDVPFRSNHLRIEFEVPGLSEAAVLASELRVMGHGRVQIRPEFPRLLHRRWRVTMTIPSMWPAAAQIRAEARELASRHAGCRVVDGDGGPLRVLIVDDSAPFRRAARELLHRRGYVVVGEAGTAAAARDAVERARARRAPDRRRPARRVRIRAGGCAHARSADPGGATHVGQRSARRRREAPGQRSPGPCSEVVPRFSPTRAILVHAITLIG